MAIFGGASYILVFIRSCASVSPSSTTSAGILSGNRSRLHKSFAPVPVIVNVNVAGGIQVSRSEMVGEDYDIELKLSAAGNDEEKRMGSERVAGQKEWE